ncbi:MAG: hypothetical protein JO218_12055 [Burkholderiales bacterium]|nr:hypothetical protein [Burkholderiales bacterium]
MSRPSPDAALELYSEHLKQRGVATKQLTLARHFLRHLLTTLRDLPQDGNGYRTAAETTLRNFPAETSFLDMVREFFPYWTGEATSAPTSRPSETVAVAAPASNLTEAIRLMDADAWSQRTIVELERQLHQLKSLVRYNEELKRAGLDDGNVEARMRLMKLLVFTIRDAPQNTDTYRAGVDKILTLFPHQERWHTFVSLAREFFYFLAQDGAAAEKLQKQISTQELNQLMAA